MAKTTAKIKRRLEQLRKVLRSESISYGELAELQGLAPHIEEGDVELEEPAGIPEFPKKYLIKYRDGKTTATTEIEARGEFRARDKFAETVPADEILDVTELPE